jgi:SAM-dependent methyltransferase
VEELGTTRGLGAVIARERTMSNPEIRWTWNRYARPIPRPPRGIEAQKLHRELQDHNPERTPLDPAGEGTMEHLSRYLLARPYLEGRRVVDGGAGFGYGSILFHRLGASVVLALERDFTALHLGASVDPQIPSQCETRRGAMACTGNAGTSSRPFFVQGDLEACPLRDGSVDLFVALEVFEHLEAPEQFLREARRVLSPEGALLLSTPNREMVSPGWEIPPNRFHVREYSPGELEALLRREFPNVEMTGQKPGPVLLQRRLEGRRGRRLAVWVERRVGFDPRRLLPAGWRRVGRRLLGDSPANAIPPPRGGEPPDSQQLAAHVQAWVSRGVEAKDPSLEGLYEYGPPEMGEMLIALCHCGRWVRPSVQ